MVRKRWRIPLILFKIRNFILLLKHYIIILLNYYNWNFLQKSYFLNFPFNFITIFIIGQQWGWREKRSDGKGADIRGKWGQWGKSSYKIMRFLGLGKKKWTKMDSFWWFWPNFYRKSPTVPENFWILPPPSVSRSSNFLPPKFPSLQNFVSWPFLHN